MKDNNIKFVSQAQLDEINEKIEKIFKDNHFDEYHALTTPLTVNGMRDFEPMVMVNGTLQAKPEEPLSATEIAQEKAREEILLMGALYQIDPEYKKMVDQNYHGALWEAYINAYAFHGHKMPATECGIIPSLRKDKGYIYREQKRKMHPFERYPKLAAEILQGKISTETLFEAVKKQSKRRSHILIKTQDHKWSGFTAPLRGQKEYAKKASNRCYNAIKKLLAINGLAFFSTLSFDVKAAGGDICLAWSMFERNVQRVLRELRTMGKLSYVRVNEATNRGFPHCHIVFTLEGYYPETKTGKNGWRYPKDETLFRAIEMHNSRMITRMRVADGVDVAGYVSKYIGKGFDFGDLQKIQPAEIDDKMRKGWLSVMVPYMCGKRTFSISQNLRREINAEASEVAPLRDYSQERDRALEVKSSKPILPCLISVLTNSTSRCNTDVYLIVDSSKMVDIADFTGDIDPKKTKIEYFVKHNCERMSCQGCLRKETLKYCLDKRQKENICENNQNTLDI